MFRTIPNRIRAGIIAFVAQPASPRPLAALRIGTAALLLLQALSLLGYLEDLYGSRGIIQAPITDQLSGETSIRVRWIAEAVTPYGISEAQCLRGLYLWYLLALSGLLIGWRTRWLAMAAWLLHLTFKTSGQSSAYGAYEFGHIALFYCAVMPVGHAWSLDRLSGRVTGAASSDARLALRVLQLHLCIIYFASGIEKATGRQWWNGEALWRAVMRNDLGQFDFAFLAAVPWLAKVACWGTLLVEIGYPFFVAWHRTRTVAVLATIGLHVGIAVMLGLWYFSGMMIVLNVAAHLVRPNVFVADDGDSLESFAPQPPNDDELRRFGEEAARLLMLEDKP